MFNPIMKENLREEAEKEKHIFVGDVPICIYGLSRSVR